MHEEMDNRIKRITESLMPDTNFKNKFGKIATLEERMNHYHTPGVSIAVINQFELEWARGFGVCEYGQSELVSETTLFQAGSISKPVFALAVMHEVQAGKLDLDMDVNHYLKSWRIPANDGWKPKVTLRQLLSHSAGTTVHGFPGYEITEEIPSITQILNGQSPANTPAVQVNVIPGLQTRYSGGGTTVAQLVLEEGTGKPFSQLMQDFLFQTFGLTQSTYEQPLPLHLQPFAATAHPWKNRKLNGKWHVYPEMAAAGLWTTPSELARVGVALQTALRDEAKYPLSSETLHQMLAPQIENHMGLGFFLEGKGETARFGHGGWDEGFVARITFYKHLGFGAVIMINSNEGSPLITEIEGAIAREYNWPDYFPPEKIMVTLAPERLIDYVGEYRTAAGLKITVNTLENTIQMEVEGQPPFSLSPESDTQFGASVVNAEVNFEKNNSGLIIGLTIVQAGKGFTASRL